MIEINGRLFDWDDDKEKINIKKHGVSFDEASTVFLDEFAIERYDTEHSDNEDRFIIIGTSKKDRILFVCHCLRENNLVTRIISARKATKEDKDLYGGAL